MLDIHDSEFNSSITPPAGDPTRALPSSTKYDEEYAVACGLEAEKQGQVRGEGDEKILKAIKVLRRMKSEGKIKKIGIACKLAKSSLTIESVQTELLPCEIVSIHLARSVETVYHDPQADWRAPGYHPDIFSCQSAKLHPARVPSLL